MNGSIRKLFSKFIDLSTLNFDSYLKYNSNIKTCKYNNLF